MYTGFKTKCNVKFAKIYFFVYTVLVFYDCGVYMEIRSLESGERRYEEMKESAVFNEITTNIIEEKKLEEAIIAEKREQIMQEAEKYIWAKYLYQSASPKAWFDCSGFINYVLSSVLKKKNNEIPRSTKMIYHQYWKYRISPESAQEWDIVLFLNRSWTPYHAEFFTHFDAKNSAITCIGSASRGERAPDWTFYKPGVDERTREYNKQKYLIIDTKKILYL